MNSVPALRLVPHPILRIALTSAPLGSSPLLHGTYDLPKKDPRRTDFALGRAAAEAALQAVGAPSVEIKSDDAGIPLFPSGFVGSIAHTVTEGVATAVAAVSRDTAVRAVGVDLERNTRILKPELTGKIATKQEAEWVATTADPSAALLRIFTAKEAAFKALYPQVRSSLSFQEAELLTPRDHHLVLSSRLQQILPFSRLAVEWHDLEWDQNQKLVLALALLPP